MTEEITKQNTLVPDTVAGLTTGIANIPDAMASAILAGVGPRVKEQLDMTETTQDLFGEQAVFISTDIIGDSTRAALAAAHAWLEETVVQRTNSK